MQLTVKVDEFRQALNIVKDTAGSDKMKNDYVRIYANAKGRVRLVTEDGSYGTDLWMNASVKAPGTVIVKCRLIQQYFSRLNQAEATLSINKSGNLLVKTKTGRQTFNSIDSSEFVLRKLSKPKSKVAVSGKTFKQLINGVSFAAGKDINRPVTEGINIVSTGKMLQMTTTDGRLIASIRKNIGMEKIDITVGIKTLVSASRLAQDDERVTMQVYKENVFGVKIGDVTMISPMLQGVFPNVRDVLPDDESDTMAIVDKAELIYMLERALPLCESHAYIRIGGSKISVKGSNQYGSFDEFIFAKTDGEDVETKFMLKEMLNIAKHIQGDTIEIGVDRGMPIVLRPSSKLKQICLLASIA